jgi:hypothetical protein
MTRHSPLPYVLATLTAAVLTACGGSSPGVDATAAEAGISSSDTTDEGTSPAQDQEADTDTDSRSGTDSRAGTDSRTDTDSQADDADGGQPGGPGGDAVDGGGGGGGKDDDSDGNPGAPGDVTVFEERNVAFADFRAGSAHQVCEVEGKCTLAEPRIGAGKADPETGVDNCVIADIQYSPPARPNPDPEGRDLFQEGASVIVVLTCPEPEPEPEPEPDPVVEPEVVPEVTDPEVADPEVVDPGVDNSVDQPQE